jgi:hypothetical protein
MISKKQLLICQECGKEFLIFPSALKLDRGKFCSRKCYFINQSKLQEKEFKWIVDSKTGCWNCVSHVSKSKKVRYPRPKITRNGKSYMIHQYSFLIHKGYIPKLIMHTCDNLICVNPNHLKEGTNKENSQDMVNKNHQAKGEENGGGVKLNSQKVIEIKQKLIQGRSLMSLANEYGVSKKTILNIKKGRKWKHINIP